MKVFKNAKPRLTDEDFRLLGVGFEPKFYKRSDIVLYNSYKKDDTEIMSNFHSPCNIEYDNRLFNSSEQLLFYINAVKWGKGFGEQQEVIEEIMKAGCGKAVKTNRKIRKFWDKIHEQKREELGRRGAAIDKWKNQYEIMKLKYKYCPEFRAVLEKYKDKIIVEDSFWGDNFAGCLYDKELRLYKGLNACGRAMKRVYNERNEIMGN